MIYLKSIYEQKIPFIEWKGDGNDLSPRAKSIFYNVLEKGLIYPKSHSLIDGNRSEFYVKVDDHVYYLHFLFTDSINNGFPYRYDNRDGSLSFIHRKVYQKFYSFSELLDYMKLYTNISDEEYMEIFKKYNFSIDDFPSGYGRTVLNKRTIADLVMFFFSDLKLIEKIYFSIKANIYNFELVKKYVKSESFDASNTYPILLKYDVKSVIPYIKRIKKKYDANIVANYILRINYDEEVFDCLLKTWPSEFIREYSRLSRDVNIPDILKKKKLIPLNVILDKTINKIIPYQITLLKYHSDGDFIKLCLSAYIKKLSKYENYKKLELLKSKLCGSISKKMIVEMGAEQFVEFIDGWDETNSFGWKLKK